MHVLLLTHRNALVTQTSGHSSISNLGGTRLGFLFYYTSLAVHIHRYTQVRRIFTSNPKLVCMKSLHGNWCLGGDKHAVQLDGPGSNPGWLEEYALIGQSMEPVAFKVWHEPGNLRSSRTTFSEGQSFKFISSNPKQYYWAMSAESLWHGFDFMNSSAFSFCLL